MDQFTHHAEAMEFAASLSDPCIREILMRAYGALVFQVAPVQVRGEFDLLFFFKVLEASFRDKEEVMAILAGDCGEENGLPLSQSARTGQPAT